MLKKRIIDFIPPSKYDKLDDETRKEYLSYQRLFRNTKSKEEAIKRASIKLKGEREKLRLMKRKLTERNSIIAHLRDNYYFNSSVVSFSNKNYPNRTYYNLCISKPNDRPKNCSLGKESIIKAHLLQYYKSNSSVRGEIEKDWKGWLKYESNYGKTYQKILDMIMDSPTTFHNITINRHTLFPLPIDGTMVSRISTKRRSKIN